MRRGLVERIHPEWDRLDAHPGEVFDVLQHAEPDGLRDLVAQREPPSGAAQFELLADLRSRDPEQRREIADQELLVLALDQTPIDHDAQGRLGDLEEPETQYERGEQTENQSEHDRDADAETHRR